MFDSTGGFPRRLDITINKEGDKYIVKVNDASIELGSTTVEGLINTDKTVYVSLGGMYLDATVHTIETEKTPNSSDKEESDQPTTPPAGDKEESDQPTTPPAGDKEESDQPTNPSTGEKGNAVVLLLPVVLIVLGITRKRRVRA